MTKKIRILITIDTETESEFDEELDNLYNILDDYDYDILDINDF